MYIFLIFNAKKSIRIILNDLLLYYFFYGAKRGNRMCSPEFLVSKCRLGSFEVRGKRGRVRRGLSVLKTGKNYDSLK